MTPEEMQARIAELEDQNKSLSGEAGSRRKELRDVQAKLKELEGIDPEVYKTMLEQKSKAEEDELKRKNDFDALQARRDAEHKKQIDQLNEKIGVLEKRYDHEVIDKQIMSVFASKDVINPEEAASLVRNRIGRDEQGAFVVADDGTPALKEGARVKIDDFLNEWLSMRAYLVKAGKQGVPGQSPKSKHAEASITRAEFDKMSGLDKAQFMRSGGKVT